MPILARAHKFDLDRIGAVASFICAVHCLLSGLLLGLLAILGVGFIGNPLVDWIFISVAVMVGLGAVWDGHRHHHSWKPAALFIGGLASILISHTVFNHVHAANQPLDADAIFSTVFAVAGGLMLVSFHFVNRRMHKASHCVCDEPIVPKEKSPANVSLNSSEPVVRTEVLR
ncbi:MAG: MerC domain-containing protein [Armatimonadetes bacterium]|nr:MerC domain-containing protein [Armatimonadota bacterium]